MNVLAEEPILKLTQPVTPAEAGVQKVEIMLDSCFRRNDADRLLKLALNTLNF
jgi:hypothetical protein